MFIFAIEKIAKYLSNLFFWEENLSGRKKTDGLLFGLMCKKKKKIPYTFVESLTCVIVVSFLTELFYISTI